MAKTMRGYYQKYFFAIALIFVAIFCLAAYLYTKSEQNKTAINSLDVAIHTNSLVFGADLKGDITLTNNSEYTVRDVNVICATIGKDDVKLQNLTQKINQSIPSHSKQLIKNINFGRVNDQARRFECSIDNAEIIK